MAWKMRKDKLKADAPEAETTDGAMPSAPEAEQDPVFDLSGSAFLPDAQEQNGHATQEPVFADDHSHVAFADEPQPTVHEPIALGSEPISLEPLESGHPAELTFQPDPLPEFDPVVSPGQAQPPEAIAMAAPPLGGNDDDAPQHTFAPDPAARREAIAPALVTTDSVSGLPRVAPFILDEADAPPTAAQTARAHSVVIRIGNLSATVPLTKPVTTIGRPDSIVENYPDMEVELDDGVSRRHAEIWQDNENFAIVDVGSTNGTSLNGEMLTPHQPVPLRPGDRIRIGERTELIFE